MRKFVEPFSGQLRELRSYLFDFVRKWSGAGVKVGRVALKFFGFKDPPRKQKRPDNETNRQITKKTHVAGQKKWQRRIGWRPHWNNRRVRIRLPGRNGRTDQRHTAATAPAAAGPGPIRGLGPDPSGRGLHPSTPDGAMPPHWTPETKWPSTSSLCAASNKNKNENVGNCSRKNWNFRFEKKQNKIRRVLFFLKKSNEWQVRIKSLKRISH